MIFGQNFPTKTKTKVNILILAFVECALLIQMKIQRRLAPKRGGRFGHFLNIFENFKVIIFKAKIGKIVRAKS